MTWRNTQIPNRDQSRIENSSRYRIGPFEVESALIEHPAVAESAVVSSPDQLRGSVSITLKLRFAET